MRRLMGTRPDEFDPRKFLADAMVAARTLCRTRFEAFGSAGQASRIKTMPLHLMAQHYAQGTGRPH
jgi:fructose-bisphosphate aldolase class II